GVLQTRHRIDVAVPLTLRRPPGSRRHRISLAPKYQRLERHRLRITVHQLRQYPPARMTLVEQRYPLRDCRVPAWIEPDICFRHGALGVVDEKSLYRTNTESKEATFRYCRIDPVPSPSSRCQLSTSLRSRSASGSRVISSCSNARKKRPPTETRSRSSHSATPPAESTRRPSGPTSSTGQTVRIAARSCRRSATSRSTAAMDPPNASSPSPRHSASSPKTRSTFSHSSSPSATA